LVAAPGCGDPFGPADVLGIWNTQSINGYSVPGTVLYQGDTYDTEYVRWTFYDGGQCVLTQLVDGLTATYDECEYTVDAERKTVAMLLLAETWDASVEGNSMTLTDPQDVVWILRAQ
jgi:hypothetical protein